MGKTVGMIKHFTKEEIESYADSVVSDFNDMTTQQLRYFFERMYHHVMGILKEKGVDNGKDNRKVNDKGGDKRCTN